MKEQFQRTALIYGQEAIECLANKHVAIFGIGGVGGYVVEALARSGVGHFTLVDSDVVSMSNINRQIIATLDTVGKYKVDVMKDRILSINKGAVVETKKSFFLPETSNEFDFSEFDYIVDAIDTVKAKIELVKKAEEHHIPIISSMGTGNKVNPMGFVVTDINKTEMDPLAKTIRQELRKQGIKKLKVVYSKETPLKPTESISDGHKREIPGSNAFVPAAAGLLIASEVVRDLTNSVTREELKR